MFVFEKEDGRERGVSYKGTSCSEGGRIWLKGEKASKSTPLGNFPGILDKNMGILWKGHDVSFSECQERLVKKIAAGCEDL